MSKIKAFLEKYLQIYKVVHKIYISLAMKYISFKLYLIRNKYAAIFAKKGSDWVEQNWNSRDQPHRSFFVERIATFSPISSILEIGCGAGPNLYLLGKRFPHTMIRGIDVNPLAVQKGNNWLAQEGISNVKLSVGRAEELGEFRDNSFDVVFTYSSLIRVSRDKIYGAVKEMTRIAHKGLILVEWHDCDQRLNDRLGLGGFIGGIWVRDYVALLKQFVPEEQIRVTKITENIWPDGGWVKYGALIEVIIC